MTTLRDEPFSPKAYWENRLTQKWGLHGVGHISYGQPYNEWLYRARKRVFLQQVRQLPVCFPEAKVLDVGSGTGFWLNMWKSVGVRQLTGSDLTQVAVEHLQREQPDVHMLQLDISDGEAVGRITQRFDLISAFDVLFHVVDDRRFRDAIKHMAALLRPGGYFLFTDVLSHAGSYRAQHEVDRTITDYTRELAENGFRTLRRVPVFVLMNAPQDSHFEFPRKVWRLAMAPVHLLPVLGYFYGAILYPVDAVLTRMLREGPATEMVVCQKA